MFFFNISKQSYHGIPCVAGDCRDDPMAVKARNMCMRCLQLKSIFFCNTKKKQQQTIYIHFKRFLLSHHTETFVKTMKYLFTSHFPVFYIYYRDPFTLI